MTRFIGMAFLIVFCLCRPCFAVEYAGHGYPKYLYDDENYILCDCKMGTAWYVDRGSVEVETETDDECILSVTVVSVLYEDHRPPYAVDDIREAKSRQYEFLYDFNAKKIYIASDREHDRRGYSALQYDRFVYIEQYGTMWRYIDPNGCWADVGIIKQAALEAYRSEYGMEFYTIEDIARFTR